MHVLKSAQFWLENGWVKIYFHACIKGFIQSCVQEYPHLFSRLNFNQFLCAVATCICYNMIISGLIDTVSEISKTNELMCR